MTALRGLGASRTPLDGVGGVVQRKLPSAYVSIEGNWPGKAASA